MELDTKTRRIDGNDAPLNGVMKAATINNEQEKYVIEASSQATEGSGGHS